MNKLITINVIIADRTYRLKISPDDEEVVRKTVKFINEKILEFKNNFAGKDMQDFLAMVVLWLATEKTATAPNISAQDEISLRLAHLEKIIQKAIEA